MTCNPAYWQKKRASESNFERELDQDEWNGESVKIIKIRKRDEMSRRKGPMIKG